MFDITFIYNCYLECPVTLFHLAWVG